MKTKIGSGDAGDAISNALDNAASAASSGDYDSAVQYLLNACQTALTAEQTLASTPQISAIENAISYITPLLNPGGGASPALDASDYSSSLGWAQAAQAAVNADSALPANNGGGGGGGNAPASNLQQLAQAVVDAINADPNYCTSVGQSGSAVNSAVHAFKVAANLNVGTGQYEASTAAAVNAQTGASTAGCPSGGVTPPPPAPPPAPVVPASSSKMWKWLAGIIVVGGVGALLYWAFGTKSGKRTFGMAAEKKRKPKKNSKKNKKR